MSIVRFNPYFADRRPAPAGWVPAADIWETPDSYRIDLEIPSVAADAVDVSLDEGVLVMSGERSRPERDEGERNHRLERRTGRFSRRFRLPEDADAERISARVVAGVLEVSIAKREERKPKRIEVIAA